MTMTTPAVGAAVPADYLSDAGPRVAGEPARSVDEDFSLFVAAHYARMLRLAELILDDPHRAQDALQNVLTKTYLRWPRVRQQNPVGYVRAALVNARTDWWRRRSSGEQPVAAVPIATTSPDHGGRVAERDAVHRSLAVLTRRERSVVVLRFFEDLSIAEIAEVLGIPQGTVKSNCTRALTKLRLSPDLIDITAPAHPTETHEG